MVQKVNNRGGAMRPFAGQFRYLALIALVTSTPWAATNQVTSASSANQPITDYEVITAPAMRSRIPTQAAFQELVQLGTRNIAVGDYGLVVYRENPLDEWQQAEVDSSVMLTAVDFADDSSGWAVGHHGVILHSADGGKTWQRQLDGVELIELEREHFSNLAQELEAELAELEPTDERYDELQLALDDALYQVDNAEFAMEEGPTKPFLDVYAQSEDVIVAVGAYGLMVQSNNGGETWQIANQTLDNPNGFHLNALSADDNYLYLAGEAGMMFRKAWGDETWETLNSPYDGSFFGTHIDAKGQLWVYGLRGNVFRSDDQGQSFVAIQSNTQVNLSGAVLDADGSTLLVGHSGTIVRIDENDQATVSEHDSSDVLGDIIVNLDGSYTMVGRGGIWQLLPTAAKE